jgi:subtilisin family serine protease
MVMLHRAAAVTVLAALALSAPALGADPRQADQWGLAMVRAPEAWSTSTGIGAQVAVIDTGVDAEHPDLGGRLLDGFDFVGDDPEGPDTDDDPSDGNGHGTHVTGIIVANRDNGEGIAGVAPGAKVLPLRVLDDSGGGFTDDIVKAIARAVNAGADVINLSLGDNLPLQSKLFDDPAYANALQSAAAAGVVVVVAAGNDGFPYCENPPVPEVLCVGAVNQAGLRPLYSSYGDGVDLMAPGGELGPGGTPGEVLSTFTGPTYYELSGTSQAAPHVAGVAALLVSLGVTGQEAVARIVQTAAAAEPAFQYGAGIVDAAAAVEGLAPPPPDPDDPDPVVGRFSTKSTVARRRVRRRGFQVKCEAVRPGSCKVVVTRRGRRVARGREDVAAANPTVVTAELTRFGKRRIKRMGERLRVRIGVTLPGEAAQTRRVTIERN